MAGRIEEKIGLEVRPLVVSHLQQGGTPSARDRMPARWFYIAAVDLIVNEDFGRMVTLSGGETTTVPLKEVISRLKLVDTEKNYDTEKYNGRRSILRRLVQTDRPEVNCSAAPFQLWEVPSPRSSPLSGST